MEYCKCCMEPIEAGEAVCPHCGCDLTQEAPPHHLRPGTKLKNGYIVGAALGEGGFGITYIGRKFDQKVAIKEFYPSGLVHRNNEVSQSLVCSVGTGKQDVFERGKRRFLREAQALVNLKDVPNIVKFRTYVQDNATAYIVMEYLDGETLRSYLEREGNLAPQEAVDLLAPVICSLQKVHQANMIHRDIAPDNIMLTENGVKLFDFGAVTDAMLYDDSSVSVILKHGYAPPEQYVSHGQQGAWTDIYALCATLYRCITGQKPPDAVNRVMNDTLRPPSQLGVRIDPALESVLMRGLATRKELRYQTVGELLHALSPFLPAGDPDKTQTGSPVRPVIKIDRETPPHPGDRNPPGEQKPPQPIDLPVEDYLPKKRGRSLKVALLILALLIVGTAGVVVWRANRSGATRSAAEQSTAAASVPDDAEYAAEEDNEPTLTDADGNPVTGTDGESLSDDKGNPVSDADIGNADPVSVPTLDKTDTTEPTTEPTTTASTEPTTPTSKESTTPKSETITTEPASSTKESKKSNSETSKTTPKNNGNTTTGTKTGTSSTGGANTQANSGGTSQSTGSGSGEGNTGGNAGGNTGGTASDGSSTGGGNSGTGGNGSENSSSVPTETGPTEP